MTSYALIPGAGSDAKPHGVLYDLARSENVWEHRTAIVATAYFIRQGDVADTFGIAEAPVGDEHDLIHKGAGGGCARPERRTARGSLTSWTNTPRLCRAQCCATP